MMIRSKLQQRALPWHAIVCTGILVFFSLVWFSQSASADDAEIVGRVAQMPAEGLIGAWEVNGFAFITTRITNFRTDKGEFVVGRCVEVEYVTVGEQTVATKVATKSDDDCEAPMTPSTTPSGTPTSDGTSTLEPTETATMPTVTVSVTPSPSATHDDNDDDDDDDDERETKRIHARIDSLPTEGLRGTWTIGGVAYEVGRETRIRQKDGPIRVGACVEVRYHMDSEPYSATRVETEHRRKCDQTGTPTPGGTIPAPTTTPQPSGTPDEDDNNEIVGLLDSFPANLIGEWVIDGEGYTATVNTEFEEDRGQFAVGVCVKAHLSSNAAVIREVETTNRFRCNGSDDGGSDETHQARGELYGVIQEFPTDLIGEWQIGGLTVRADADTEFKQRKGAFAEGVTVKVHFVVREDGTFYATEIETKFATNHGGDDDDNDVYEGAEGHAYGTIAQLPEELIGEWVVGGISYTVTSETHFVRPHSDFALDVLVRVKYRTDVEGNRIARQIKTTRSNGGASDEGHATLYGYVDQMPMNGFVGEWMVDGVAFYADITTKFKEEHGVLGLGSYVKMEYFTADGRNVLHEIESEVPPGAGDDTAIGEIENIEEENSDTVRLLSGTAVNAAIWTIDGQAYLITAATDLNDFQGDLSVGSQALVNSYTADDGTLVATQVRGVTLSNTIYLPSISR